MRRTSTGTIGTSGTDDSLNPYSISTNVDITVRDFGSTLQAQAIFFSPVAGSVTVEDGGAFTLGAYNGSLTVGDCGVDVTNHVVWAVTNHNSEFAVINTVPEPSAAVLLFGGVALLAGLRRSRRG